MNPAHLWLGDPAENTADMMSKQRSRSPVSLANGKTKLSDDDVRDIRRRRAAGETLTAIARDYGIHSAHAGRIAVGKRRRDTGPDAATRQLVLDRDEGCVICGRSDLPVQIHHRRPRGAGGSKDAATNRPPNLITLCADHHRWVESNREISREKGYLVPSWEDPATVRVRHAVHGTVLLTHDGLVRGWQ